MQLLLPVVLIVLLIVSVVLHELAHGLMALALGDPTAKLSGRLTLNPIKHLDPVGSVIMPAFFAFVGGMPLGYAKPVPVNHFKLKGKDRGFAIVAAAGPAANMVLAFVGVTVARTVPMSEGVLVWVLRFVALNVFLAAFNLVPIPPLDGSRLLRLVLRPRGIQILDQIEPYGFLILLLLVFVLQEPFFRFVGLIQSLLVQLIPGL